MQTAVIFDLDGTLIDSAPDIHAVANAVLALHGFAPLPVAQVRGFVGRGVPHLVHCLIAASDADPEGPLHAQMVAEFVARYSDAVALTTLYPGVRGALEALAAAGHPLGLCTNKPVAPTLAVLRHFGLEALFGAVVGGDSLAVRKPDPAPLHQAHFLLGRGPVLYVGDSEIDAETAERAGLGFALYTEGYRRSDLHAIRHDIAFSDHAMLPGIVAHWPAPR